MPRRFCLALSLLALSLLALDMPVGAQQAAPQGAGDVLVNGRPALRLGDGEVVQGSPDVMINGRPAVTLGDRTGCGGSVASGSSGVFINGKPMATTGTASAPCPGR